MSIKHLYIALLALLCTLVTAHGAHVPYNVADYNRKARLSTEELMRQGQHFLQDEGQPDSALVCYTIVSQRVDNKDLSREEMYHVARAFNNLGYLYTEYYFDFEKAYENLSRSLELSKQYGFDDNVSYGYLNLASIIDSRNELYGGESLSVEVLDNTKIAFAEAIKVKEWNVAVTSIYNMLTMIKSKADVQSIKPELEQFKRLELTDSVEMWPCTRAFCQGMEAYLDGQYAQALESFDQMLAQTQHVITNRQQCIIRALRQKGIVLSAMQRYGDAIACLQQVESIAQEQGLQVELINNYHVIAEVYKAMGNEKLASQFDYKYLKARDEFVHHSHAEKLEKSRFLDEMRRVNDQVAVIEAKHERTHQLLLMMSLIAAVIMAALVLLVRSYFKQRTYIRHLYEKNVQLLAANESPRQPAAQEDATPKYQIASSLDQESKDRLFAQIKQVMGNIELICQPNFSLQQLADEVSSNSKYVSQVVNECYGKSFKQVLNEQRVLEACRLLNDTEQYGHLTIEAIAAQLGFNSRSNFTVTFKRITGISPSDFLKMAKEN